MPVQMFFVQPSAVDERSIETVADFVVLRGGFILMTTAEGSLIVAIDDSYADELRANALVRFASGVMLDPEGSASEHLQRLFAHNVAAQLTARGWRPGDGDAEGERFPPGYRPLRWPTGAEGGA